MCTTLAGGHSWLDCGIRVSYQDVRLLPFRVKLTRSLLASVDFLTSLIGNYFFSSVYVLFCMCVAQQRTGDPSRLNPVSGQSSWDRFQQPPWPCTGQSKCWGWMDLVVPDKKSMHRRIYFVLQQRISRLTNSKRNGCFQSRKIHFTSFMSVVVLD